MPRRNLNPVNAFGVSATFRSMHRNCLLNAPETRKSNLRFLLWLKLGLRWRIRPSKIARLFWCMRRRSQNDLSPALVHRAPRRFPPPWSIDEIRSVLCRDRQAPGQKLANIYFEDEHGRRSAAKLLTKDEARGSRRRSPSYRSYHASLEGRSDSISACPAVGCEECDDEFIARTASCSRNPD